MPLRDCDPPMSEMEAALSAALEHVVEVVGGLGGGPKLRELLTASLDKAKYEKKWTTAASIELMLRRLPG